MAQDYDWRNPRSPSWVRVNPSRPHWEQNVLPSDPASVKGSLALGKGINLSPDYDPDPIPADKFRVTYRKCQP